MNKNGFTLIEIIVCIALISIIGTTTTIAIVNKNTNNEVTKITNKILEAANVFVEVEKDENGNSYFSQIAKGAKGVEVPLINLVNKGYVQQKDIDKLYDLNNERPTDDESYYVLFVENSKDYCGEDKITTIPSWTSNKTPVYLCKNTSQLPIVITEEKEVTKYIVKYVDWLDKVKTNPTLSKYAVSSEYYNSASEDEKQYLTDQENGLYVSIEEDGYFYFYFRGAVDNNYVNLGDKKWRILWFNTNGEMKLILDEAIPICLSTTSGSSLCLNTNDFSIKNYYEAYKNRKQIYTNFVDETTLSTNNSIPVYIYDKEFTSDSFNGINVMKNQKDAFINSLNIEEYLKKIKYCFNQTTRCSSGGCYRDYAVFEDSLYCNGDDKSSYEAFQGYLTVSEAKRAGFSENSIELSKRNSGINFILDENNYTLINHYIPAGKEEYYYYISNKIDTYQSAIYSSSYSFHIRNNNSGIETSFYSGYQAHVGTFTYKANAIKPTIVIDFNKYMLNDQEGTKEKPYELVERTQ